jgi:hypothetical protein
MEGPDPSALHQRYAEMSDGELMSLANEKELLEASPRRLLDSELLRRGLAESDVVAFRDEAQRESDKGERIRRKRVYRFLVGAGGPWERAYSYLKWAALGAFGTGYMLRLFGCRNPLLIVGGATVGSLITLPITICATHCLAPKHKRKRASDTSLPPR